MKMNHFSSFNDAQKGIYESCIHNAESLIYNIPTFIKFPGIVQIEAIEYSIRVLLKKHKELFAKIVCGDEDLKFDYIPSGIHIEAIVTNEKYVEKLKKSFIKPFEITKELLFRVH